MNIFSFFKNLFREKPKEPPFNLHHPDIANNIEFAFEVGGRKFYRFIKDYKMPIGRYKYAEAYLYESELRMTLKNLLEYMDELEKNIDGSKGQINIGNCFKVIWSIRGRAKLIFSPETIEKLASAIYFDENEVLSDLDEYYCKQKVAFWKKHEFVGFFLTEPIVDLLTLKGFSETNLPDYLMSLTMAEDLAKNLILDPERQYSPNS